MKKIIFTSILLIMSAASFSQHSNPPPALTKEDYLQKRKKQKTTGWILLGGGVVTTFVGLTQWSFAGYDESDADKQRIGTVLIFTGLAATITSIPFFIAAKRNRKKSLSLSFKNEAAPFLKGRDIICTTIPSFTLRINI